MFIIESITTYITTFVALFVGYLTYKWLIYPFYFSPLRNLPGPSPDNFILGNLNKVIFKSGGGLIHVEWTEQYGGIYKVYGLFNELRIAVTDEKILQQILVREPYSFVRPNEFRGILNQILGQGILATDGEVHRKQRKLMSPAFSNVSVKDMVPSIAKIGNRLKELWKKEIENNQKNVGKNTIKINLMDYMSKATLDVIGIIGFDYEFDSLTSTSELAQAYDSIFNTKNIYGLIYIVMTSYFPILKKLPNREKRHFEETSRIIDKVTTKLVRDKLDKYVKGELENNKDLLSNLIKSNHEVGLDENEKMGFDELKNQIMTFLLAGHETTGVSLTWALYYLSKHQGVQNKLRKEIVKEFPDKDFVPTFEQVNSLEYLNAVCKEVLRVATPVTYTLRSTAEDTTFNGYFIPKDTGIIIPMYAIHNMPSIWGPDFKKFNPGRWLSERTKNITNCNYLPFLTGQKGCIGNKMAYCEMKVFLVILIRNFEFHEVEGLEVKKTQILTFRPDPAAMSWIKETNN